MRGLVTGVAGFIGSHLAQRLVADGWDVVGTDRFTDYYPRLLKERNPSQARDEPRFGLAEVGLAHSSHSIEDGR